MTSETLVGCVCQMGERWESCCFGLSEGLPRSLWWLPVSSGCTARGWGATGGGWGALWVGGAFVQYAQPLASGARPSWSRPTRVISSQFWAGPESNHDHRDPAQTSSRGRWGRTRDGDSGLCLKDPELAPARPGVHSADTTEPAVEAPSGDRWNPAVLPRCAAPVRL